MDQPSITPGSNGYLAPLPTPQFGTNPWAVAGQADQGIATQMATQGAQNISGLQGQMQALQSQPQNGLYPTYPNAYGIGSQSAFGSAGPTPTAQSAPGPTPQVPMEPDYASRGANPWSLRGESNAR